MKIREHFRQIMGDSQNGAFNRAFAVAYVSAFLILMTMIGVIELSHFLRQF